jgi:hypothetical protein
VTKKRRHHHGARIMKIASFTNYTSEPFTGKWNGVAKTFKPGEKRQMAEYLARHFAKHLANQELIKKNKQVHTSPKDPEKDEVFMIEFNKAFFIDEGQTELDGFGMEIENTNRPQHVEAPAKGQGAPMILKGEGGDDDDADEFEKKADTEANKTAETGQ